MPNPGFNTGIIPPAPLPNWQLQYGVEINPAVSGSEVSPYEAYAFAYHN